MSKYLNQLYNKNQNLQKKLNAVKSKPESSEDHIKDSCHNSVPPENNNLKPKLGKIISFFSLDSDLTSIHVRLKESL